MRFLTQEIFQKLDSNGDGKVSKKELRNAMGGPMKLRKRFADAFIKVTSLDSTPISVHLYQYTYIGLYHKTLKL